jgi:type IV pilus assembly protein PilB
MNAPRIGQILSNLVPLSNHDVEEILQEQKATRQRFGDAALALGMVMPQHVWKAWLQQMQDAHGHIDLELAGIDSQAIDQLSPDLARQYRVVPVRTSGNDLLVACEAELTATARQELQSRSGCRLIFATANAEQVEAALERLYAPASCGASCSTAAA